ncbi:MAG: caspase family protein [Steroidobacteraceae bacterium]
MTAIRTCSPSGARADAKASAELKAVGFEVTLKQDLTQKAMKSALRDFKAQVAGGDEVVFYFSGHGVQFGGTNYLIPVDIIQRRYPDGSTSTQVTSQGRLLNGVVSGTWYDKFQSGRFQLTLGGEK